MKTLFAALFLVAGLLPTTQAQCAPPVMCPREVVKEFLRRDIAGVLLRSAQEDPVFNRKTQGRFFLRYDDAPPKQLSLWVISPDYSVDDVSIQGDRAEIYLGFLSYGQIDAMVRWHRPDPGITKYAETFHLSLSDQRSETGEDSKITTYPVTPPQWLISDPPSMYVSVETAIRYIRVLRQRTQNPTIQRNADATLAALAKLKE